MATAGAEGQEIVAFARLCKAAFKQDLKKYGFKRARKECRAKSEFALETFRRGEDYIQVSANTYYLDEPSACYVSLGQGVTTMPESDWNHIALWHLQVEHGATPPDKQQYTLQSVGQLPEVLDSIRRDLLLGAADFLAGDLAAFRNARARLAAMRRPYTIHTPDSSGHYFSRDDPESTVLRAKYSRASNEENDAT